MREPVQLPTRSSRPSPPSRLPVLGNGGGVHDKCARCGGRCCGYFALQIETPRTYDDFDDIRWYVAHEGVQVFKEGRRWFLQVDRRCTHLSPQGLCGIYEDRPKICRDHKVQGCEFENEDPFNYSVHFQRSEDVRRYMSDRWPRGRPQARRSPAAPRRALPKSMRFP